MRDLLHRSSPASGRGKHSAATPPGGWQPERATSPKKRRAGALAAWLRGGYGLRAAGVLASFVLLYMTFSAVGGRSTSFTGGTASSASRAASSTGQLRASVRLSEQEAAAPSLVTDVGPSKVDRSNFVHRQGPFLELNGQAFRFGGATNYYVVTRAAEPSTRSQVADVFETAEKLGLKVLRFWAFADGDVWNSMQPQQGRLDERIFREGLDWAVEEARQLGVRVILAFTDANSGYGGMEQYVKWAGKQTICDFYATPAIQAAFRDYIAALVLRRNSISGLLYRDDPTILGWELANGPRCPGDDSGDTVHAWIAATSKYVKQLDPNHIVTVGHFGFFGESTPDRWGANPGGASVTAPLAPWVTHYDAVCEGTDFVRDQAIDSIDAMSLQLWPDEWLVGPEPWKVEWGRQWLRAHIEVATQLKKPLLLTSFNKQRAGSGSDMAARNAFYAMVYHEVQRAPIVAGTLFWMAASNAYPDYDGYTIYTSRVATAEAQPARSPVSIDTVRALVKRSKFSNWEAMLECVQRRGLGSAAENSSAPGAVGGSSPWTAGWAGVLDVVNTHAQVMAKMAGQQLSDKALAHEPLRRPRPVSLLPDGPIGPAPAFPEDRFQSVAATVAAALRSTAARFGYTSGSTKFTRTASSAAAAQVPASELVPEAAVMADSEGAAVQLAAGGAVVAEQQAGGQKGAAFLSATV